IRTAAERFDGLSIMYNNAGGGMLANVHEYSADLWDRLIRLNLTGVFNGIKAAAPVILASGGGSIVSTASISGVRPAAGEAPYAPAKAAVVPPTATSALESAPRLRANAISPGSSATKPTDPTWAVPGERTAR